MKNALLRLYLFLHPFLGYCLLSLAPGLGMEDLMFCTWVFFICLYIFTINLPFAREHTNNLYIALVIIQLMIMGGLDIFQVIKEVFLEYGFLGGSIRLFLLLYPFFHHALLRKMTARLSSLLRFIVT